MTRTRVGFVGVGQIGSGMVMCLLRSGYSVVVHARRAEVREQFAALGATTTATLAEAASGADVVAVCVLTDEQVLEVALGQGGLLAAMAPRSVLVVHTTGSPSTATRLAAAGAPRGVSVVDAPVSGSPEDARAGQITLLVGGDVEAVERAGPMLTAFGDPVLHLGPLGRGQEVKLINNLLLAAQVQLAAEAIRVGDALGLDRGELTSAIAHCSGASRALAMAAYGDPSHPPFEGIGRFIGKDVVVASQAAQDVGIDLGFLGEVAGKGPSRFGDFRDAR